MPSRLSLFTNWPIEAHVPYNVIGRPIRKRDCVNTNCRLKLKETKELQNQKGEGVEKPEIQKQAFAKEEREEPKKRC